MLVLIRDVANNDAVMGRLELNGQFICYTLENAKKIIPCGMYSVQNSRSLKFKRELPLIWNSAVPEKRGVRIHVGNYCYESSACVLVGMGRKIEDYSLTESALAETMVTMLCRSVSRLVICEEH